MRAIYLLLLEVLFLRFMGGGSGSDSGAQAAEQRRQEDERQRRINQGTQQVNQIFSSGRYGVNPLLPEEIKWGNTYYDASGAPVALPAGPGVGTDGSAPYSPATARMWGNPRDLNLFGGVSKSTSGFDPAYYDSIAKAYEDYYTPQLNEKAQRARRSIALAPGASSSSSGARRAGEFETDYQRELVGLGERGRAAATKRQGEVEDTRSTLLNQVQAGAGIDTIGNQATARAQMLSEPPLYQPLGDLFSRYVTDVANARNAWQVGYKPIDNSLLFNRSGNASVNTVGRT